MALAAFLALTLALPAAAAPPTPPQIAPQLPVILNAPGETIATVAIDPLTIDDDDFARDRDPALWRGLRVDRIGFRDGPIGWRLWRIVNVAHASGPLWVIPHDDENATFSAAIRAVKSWGGVVIVVDAGARDTSYAARFSGDGVSAPALDPNRNFTDAAPVYNREVLRDLTPLRRLIIALHTNAPGYSPYLPRCPGEPSLSGGSGDISMALCTATLTPRRARHYVWPFDDDDTLALMPHLVGDRRPNSGYCAAVLIRDEFNLVFESVGASDGSLSNYAALHGLNYINFETRDRGNHPAGIAEARDRLLAMVDRMMERCAPIAGLVLNPTAREKR